jgi:hypothetical protein
VVKSIETDTVETYVGVPSKELKKTIFNVWLVVIYKEG